MLGDVDNWSATIPALAAAGFRVLAPVLPIYTAPLERTSVDGAAEYVIQFLNHLGGASPILVGNSLGGHLAIRVATRIPERVRALVLSGASGLYEVNIGATTPRRFDREFVRDRTAFTFYDPIHATDTLVDRMMGVLADRPRLLRLIKMARSAHATYVGDDLPTLSAPTLLVWGKQDRITPPEVGEHFHHLLPQSDLVWIDACGHAPMIEQPERFNAYLLDFLRVHARAKLYLV